MNSSEENKNVHEYLLDKTIISMYLKGFSMKSIIKYYYNKKNKKQKPIKIEGNMYFPTKIYTMEYCKAYVYEIIYKHLLGDYETSSSAKLRSRCFLAHLYTFVRLVNIPRRALLCYAGGYD